MKQKAQNIFCFITEKTGIPKSVVWGAFGTFLLTALSVSYAFITTTSQTNKEVPTQDAKITSLLSKDSIKTIQIIKVSNTIDGVDKKVDAVQTNMEKGFERIEKRLNEMTGQNRQILNQTK